MRFALRLLAAAVLALPAAEARARRGFFGTYHSTNGAVPGGNESVWAALEFGTTATYNSGADGGFALQADVDFQCHDGGGVNAILGLVVAHSEGGVLNNPNDTALWSPATPPGLVQAAWRWSQLSQHACPQVAGIVIDDFVGNYGGTGNSTSCARCPASSPSGYGSKSAGEFCCPRNASGGHCPQGGECCLVPGDSEGCQGVARCGVNPGNRPACNPSGLSLADVQQVKGALLGHALDPRTGKVDFSSPALTPGLRLFVVWYTSQTAGFVDDGLMAGGVVDGVSLWVPGPEQQAQHGNFTAHVRAFRQRATADWGRAPASLPILGGGYLTYSSIGYMPPAPFRDLWAQSVTLYDSGELAGFFLFAASAIPRMNASLWREWDLPGLLDETYRPWLGTVCVTVTTSNASSRASSGAHAAGGRPVAGAIVAAEYAHGQGASERTFITRKLAGPDGRVCIDGWTGKAQPRPHVLTVSREGFENQTVVTQLPRAATANLTVVLVRS